ncbi:MAG: hypothetical protein ABSG25_10450, partial [Bryobacteraceae bacterium]
MRCPLLPALSRRLPQFSKLPPFIGTALAVAVPCFWQSRIQAGDLSSHVYNAWLASLVEQGKAPGLALFHPWTNFAFDVALAFLTRIIGSGAAQKLLVVFAVELFFWGAMALTLRVTGRVCWFLAPCFAVLAYGWVFHAGFFGFYYSFGFSIWALVALCQQRRARLAAVPLFPLAISFHALPVVWALSAAVYAWAAKRISPRTSHRILLAVAALAAIAGLRFYLTSHFVTVWQIRQLFFATGADQVWIYDAKYLKLFGCILLLAILLLYDLIARKGIAAVAGGLPFQIACLTATGVLLIPVSIQLPQYQHRLTFIADRMSLATAVCFCIMLGLGNPPKALKGALMALAAVYFFFVYSDARAVNRIEDRV